MGELSASQVDYETWNEVLAEKYFGTHMAEAPAYVDVDEAVLGECATSIGLEPTQASKALAKAVRSTLRLEGGDVLGWHNTRFTEWRAALRRATVAGGRGATVELPTPPFIAALACFVLAAERMGSQDGLAAAAYYPRLAQLLGLDDAEAARLKHAFPVTESYWRGLNEYLEAAEGYYGLPTSYALSFRYVGIPQSQALVRAADRAKLPDFFHQFGLAPGSELVASDLERLLEAWVGATPSPVSANLQRLWKGGKARERIAGVVGVELSFWDGTAREGSDTIKRSRGDLQLTALLRQRFGNRSLELSFAARLPRSVDASSLRVRSAEGSPLLGVLPAAGSRLRPLPGSQLDPESLVGAVLDLEEPTSEQAVGRHPRRVVPLRKDELLGAWVEADKVQLAETTMLLVKDEEKLLTKVTGVFDTYGAYGEVVGAPDSGHEVTMQGVPRGWVLLPDVQLFAVPQDVKHLDLQVLVPLSTAQLILAEGLKLPGRIRKWSSLSPPEIRAAVAEADEITVTLREIDEDRTLLEEWKSQSAALVIPLDDAGLEDGDYEIALLVNGQVVTQQTLRLRSSDTPDVVSWETCDRLNYLVGRESLAAVTASDGEPEAPYVDGAQTIGRRDPSPGSQPVGSTPPWAALAPRSSGARQTIVLGHADPKSCSVTGAHRIQLPIWHGGRSSSSTIIGVCETCGIKKTLPARPRWKKSDAARTVVDHAFSPPERRVSLAMDWDRCLDSLIHLGGGRVSQLERVASHADGSSLFADEFLRTLEVLGHVDVSRDSHMAAEAWEANPCYLAETHRRGFALTGVWSGAGRRALALRLLDAGATLEPEQDHAGEATTWYARGADAATLGEAVQGAGVDAEVVVDAARALLRALPPLSEVEAEMPLEVIPSHTKAQRLELPGARWVTVPGVGAPGAYRVEQSFRTSSIWVDQAGALERQCRVGSVQMVKHLAALHSGSPLLAYAPQSETLVVPMGADLPGLYGRAAVLCSGRPPMKSPRTRSLAYRDVPVDVAETLAWLLSH